MSKMISVLKRDELFTYEGKNYCFVGALTVGIHVIFVVWNVEGKLDYFNKSDIMVEPVKFH